MRREELCKLRVRDLQRRDGVLQFRIEGKGEKIRYVPVGMKALRLVTEYLEAAGHKDDLEGPLFRPVQNRVTGELNKPLLSRSVLCVTSCHEGGKAFCYSVCLGGRHAIRVCAGGVAPLAAGRGGVVAVAVGHGSSISSDSLSAASGGGI